MFSCMTVIIIFQKSIDIFAYIVIISFYHIYCTGVPIKGMKISLSANQREYLVSVEDRTHGHVTGYVKWFETYSASVVSSFFLITRQ